MKKILRLSYFLKHGSKLLFCLRLPLLTAGMMLAAVGFGYGQIKVNGQVVSAEDGASIPGATVLVKGSSSGTVTDIEGHYSLAQVMVPQDPPRFY